MVAGRSPLTAMSMTSTTAASLVTLAPLQLFTGQFLHWAVVFAVLAIIAALVGFRGIAGISMELARLFVLVFLVLLVVSLVL